MTDARPIEAVVFDMDGVLVDSEPIWRAVERDVFAGVGIDLTDEDLLPTMGVRVADVVARWHRRHPWDEPSREQVAETIVERVAETIERQGTLERGSRTSDRLHRRARTPDGPRILIADALDPTRSCRWAA